MKKKSTRAKFTPDRILEKIEYTLVNTADRFSTKNPIPNYRIFSLILVSLLIGVFVSSFYNLIFKELLLPTLIILIFQTGICYIFKKTYPIKISLLTSFCFFCGILIFSYSNTKLLNFDLPFGQEKEFVAVVDSIPDRSGSKQNFYIKTSDFSGKTKIYLQTSKHPEFFYSDKLSVKGKIEKPANFADFDWINYLKRYGTVATIRDPKIKTISNNSGNQFVSTLYNFREKFKVAVEKNLPEPESSLAIGILIGEKQNFSDEILNQFNRSGITHIIALSGYNVTIIVIFLSAILLGILSRKQIFFLSAILIILFVIMTGASSSVIRAAIISLLVVFGKTIGRKADKANLILLSATIMVLINPFVLKFDLGFQLSFLAFLGLICFSTIWNKIFEKKIFANTPKFILMAISETLSAQILVLPLILFSFGRISIIAPVTNVLILSIIPLTMGMVFAATILYWLVAPIGHLAFPYSYLPLKYILVVSKYFANMRFSSIEIAGNWQILFVIFYSILVSAGIIIIQKTLWREKPIQ